MFTPLDSNATIGTTERSIIGDTTVGVPLTSTTEAVVVVRLDLSALLAGDEFELRVYSRVDGGTQRRAFTYPFVGTYGELFESAPIWLRDGYDITLIKVAGTDRAIRWEVISDQRADVPTVAAIAAGVLAATLEGSVTVARGLRGILRQLLAKRSGYGTATVTVRDMADAKTSHVIVQDDADDPTQWNSVTLTDLD